MLYMQYCCHLALKSFICLNTNLNRNNANVDITEYLMMLIVTRLIENKYKCSY